MNLSSEAQENLQAFAASLKKWLHYCSPSILERHPDLAGKKKMLEKSLVMVTKLLESEEEEPSALEDHGALFLQWDEGVVDLFKDKIELTCWCGFPLEGFVEANVEKKVTFSFEGQEVEGSMVKKREWTNNYHCIRYNCTVTPPSAFRSGTINVKVALSYGEKQDALEKTLELGGISPAGQAAVDFLEGFEIDKKLGESPWSYVKDNGKDIENAQTMSQLLPIEQALEERLTAIEGIEKSYKNFAHTEVLKGLIYYRTYETTVQKHFGGYWKEALPLGSASREKLGYLERWKVYSEKECKEIIEGLQTNLASIRKKIEDIKAARALAEENYTTAKGHLTEKSKGGAELLDHIYAITQLDKKYEELKLNYPMITGTEATDAHKLILQPQKTIQELQEQLQELRAAYKAACAQVLESYLLVYKNPRGKLKDKSLLREARELTKAAKEAKEEIPLLSLSILGHSNPLPLHTFIFASTTAFVEQANAFYMLYKEEFLMIYRDVMVIDASKAEMSIKAYDPLYRDITGKDQMDASTLDRTIYGHERTSENLVDKKGINAEDVDQGQLGDCYFLAGVASLASNDPEKIYGRADSVIQGPNKDGTYTVRLYIPDQEGQPKRVSILVEPSFVTKKIIKENAPTNDRSEDVVLFAQPGTEEEMWVQLLEKAMAQLEGSYKEIEGGQKEINYRGIQFLTGEDISYHQLKDGTAKAIKELVELYETNNKTPKAQFGTKKVLVQKATLAEEVDPKDKKPASGEDFIVYRKNTYLYVNHAYSLKAILRKGKEVQEFILSNPHNDTEVKGGVEISITPQELENYFDSIIITK